MCVLTLQISHRPDVQIADALASTFACTTAGAQYVRAAEDLELPHRPDGRIADVLHPTHACTTANASVNYRGYVSQRP